MESLRKRLSRRSFVQLAALASASALIASCADDEEAPAAESESEDSAAESPDDSEDQADEDQTDEDQAEDDDEAANGDAASRFNWGEPGQFESFNPWRYNATNKQMYNLVFSRLLYMDASGETVTDVADSWEMNDDATMLTITMKDNVVWHDGQECTAGDLVTMFEYTQDEEFSDLADVSKMTSLLAPVEEVVAADDYTLELHFTEPTPFATDFFDFWFLIRDLTADDPAFVESLPVGTGPFVIEEWNPSEYLRLRGFEDFYVEGEPVVDEVMLRRFEASETIVPNLRSDALDGVFVTELGEVEALRNDDNFWLEVTDTSGSIFNIIVNTDLPPFDTREARQALSYSLNRGQMIDAAFFGISSPITTAFYHEASLGYREDLVMAHEFDLERAEQLFNEAGVEDLSQLTMSINVTPRWPQMELFCLMWQQDLAQIGVTLEINEVETALFYEIADAPDLQGNALHPWLNGRTTLDPAIFWGTQPNYRGGGPNRYPYTNEELEDLVAEGATEPNEERRREIYQRLNEIVIEECHMLQVATDPFVFAFRNEASGVEFDFSAIPFLTTATVEG